MTAPELAYFMGSPRRRFDDTEWDAVMGRWAAFTGPAGIFLTYPGDKCDVARSRHINVAKGLAPMDDPGLGFAGNIWFDTPASRLLREGKPNTAFVPPAAMVIQVDSDVWPKMGLADMLRILHQDFEDGFDVVTAPTVNNETLTTMAWTPDGRIPGDRCVEVLQGAFGFVAFSARFIRTVTAEKHWHSRRCTAECDLRYEEERFWMGTPQEQSVPLYCHFGPNEDDSISFSHLVREQGFKLGCDARLQVAHRKAHDLDPSSAQWMLAYRNVTRAQHEDPTHANRYVDLYLQALRVINRGLMKSEGKNEDERERKRESAEPEPEPRYDATAERAKPPSGDLDPSADR